MITAFSNLVNLISPSSGGVYESARLNDNLDGTGGITLTWNSATNNTVPVGMSVVWNDTKYTLLEPYAPQKASAIPHYRYEVTFQHPLARLARVPFYIKSKDSEQNDIDLHTSTFTGYVQTIAQKLADFFSEYGDVDAEFGTTFGEWTTNFEQLSSVLMTTLITVDFDGCSIRSAATRIADAVGCNVFFDWSAKTIRFISGTTVEGEYYNCFRVLGGTTNMAKKTVQGLYAAVTQRLTLDSTWPGSMMYRDNNGSRPEVLLTRDLIFDDIYPKMELYIRSARPRYCYLTDEDGNKIVDHWEKDGATVPASTEGATAVYKLYCKWYVTLEYGDNSHTVYDHDPSIQIADRPLCLLFQPDYANTQVSSPLAGREFEVVYFQSSTEEWEEDDVLPETNPFTAQAGEFRIVFGAEGETILPSLPADGLCPQVGNKVTLTNVAVESATDPNDNTYKEIAQEELRLAALEVIALMDNDNGQYQYQSVTEIPVVGAGKTQDGHTGVVTAVSADLDTGVADITIGSWSRKTLTGGVRDKIDSVQAGSKGETEKDRSISKGSFDTLMRTVKKTSVSQEVINTLGARIDQIAQQADAQFNVIFGVGDPTTSANPPEENWSESEKELHLQDIYYDMNKEAASTGGRAWRWKVNEGVYYWDEITDHDTLLSLQKIADVAGDGVLSGGAEKTRVFIEWRSAADEMTKLLTEAANYGITVNENNDPQTEADLLVAAYWELWRVLNAGTAKEQSTTYNTTPSWLSDLTVTSRFAGTSITPAIYKNAWNNFYAAFSTLSTAITGQTRTLVASKISYYASYDLPRPPYTAGAMWFKLASQNQGETNGVLYQCINTNTTGPASMSDWKKVSNFGVSIGSLLGTLFINLESRIKRLQTNYPNDPINVIISSNLAQADNVAPLIHYDIDDGVTYIKYNNVTGSYTGYEYISPSSEPTLAALFADIYAALGETSFKIWPELDDEATLYDIYGKRSSFTDSFTKQTIEGELSVWMKGETAWTQVLDNTEGILQNYGDHIVAAIYGVDASTAQSMSTNLTLAKNFAQLMARAGSDSGEDMKDVAGIKVVADEHEDPNDDTSPITKGHVEIVGDLITGDKEIIIKNQDLPISGRPGGRKSARSVSAITFGGRTSLNYPIIIENDAFRTGDAFSSTARMEIKSFSGWYYAYEQQGTVIEDGYVSTSRGYSVYSPSNDTYAEGVGSISSPVTFTTADGKTVTVMGGIITDIS